MINIGNCYKLKNSRVSCPVNGNFCKDSAKEGGQENTSIHIYVVAFPRDTLSMGPTTDCHATYWRCHDMAEDEADHNRCDNKDGEHNREINFLSRDHVTEAYESCIIHLHA